MRILLRLLAVLLALGALALWLATGANRGWTKNRVEKRTVDEVTGIEGITYEDRFVPGIDFLAGTLVGAGALAGVSFFASKKGQSVTRL
jgi:hypothetical protein